MTAPLPFMKMHGLGNDFVVIDATVTPYDFSLARLRNISDRKTGIGCDQIIVMETSTRADVFMRIYNTDGSDVEACGNATRCVADHLMRKKKTESIIIETRAGLLMCTRHGDNDVTVDMGPPKLEWQQIPLSENCDTLHVPIQVGPHSDPVAVNMGNPHAVLFVDDAMTAEIEKYGPILENHAIFPARANIEFVQILDRNTVRMRVWERGAGVTLACGSGACATAVAAIRRGLTDRLVHVVMDGGTLQVEWRAKDDHVLMTGPSSFVFDGVWRD